MANKRIYIIAREHGLTSKEIMEKLGEFGIEVKSQMKAIDEETATRVIAAVKGRKFAAKRIATAPAAEAPKKKAPVKKKAPAKTKKAPAAAEEKAKKKKPAKAAAKTDEKTKKPAAPAKKSAEKAEEKKPARKTAKKSPDKAAGKKTKTAVAEAAAPPDHKPSVDREKGSKPERKTAAPAGRTAAGRPRPDTKPGRTAPSGARQAPGPRGGAPGPRGGAPGPRGGAPVGSGAPRSRPPARQGARPETRPGTRRRRPRDRKRRRLSPQEMVPAKRRAAPPTQPKAMEISITEAVNVKELASKMGIRLKDVMAKLMQKGVMISLNQSIDPELAVELAGEFGVKAEVVTFEEDLLLEALDREAEGDETSRHPVVTVMGHVDHGKTSLLDAIRKTNIISTEAGGITQHIGAYHVKVGDKAIVFLDTPGHEAFTRMRARGAGVTDLVILVVAADDGVMPQTVEAINHAKAAEVPILVAVNKMDKPGANPARIKQQLTEHEILTEDLGGETVTVEISAKTGDGINELLEMILLVTDIQDRKANPTRIGAGTVLEAHLDKGRGPVATVLIQDGTVRTGDHCIAGANLGKVRAMFNDRGQKVEAVGPSHPVQILGLQGVPEAGDSFQVVKDAVKASKISTFRQSRLLAERQAGESPERLTLDQLYSRIEAGELKELPLIIKGDVQGSVEVLRDAMSKTEVKEIKPRIIHSGVGAVTENDVLLAAASNAIIIAFNVRPQRGAADLAERESVDIRVHNVVYKVIEEIQQALRGLLEPTFEEKLLGRVEVRNTFRIPKIGTIAGSYVTEGLVTRNANARLLRDDVVIYDGKISSLKRFKDDTTEVKNGFECGIGLDNYDDIKVGDVIEVYKREQVQADI